MPHSKFVHLHNHTEYSLLDGANRVTDEKGAPGDFIKAAVNYKMPALAITDHGNMYGALEFYRNCVKSGIKPIIGCEMYVAVGSRHEKKIAERGGNIYHHLVLLAKNETGYKNLMKLSSLGFLEGFYYKPRVDKELLKEYKEGLIALSACLKGEIAQAMLEGGYEAAQKALFGYLDIFGKENFYIELMDNGIAEQRKLNPLLHELAVKNGVGVVATSDCHYTNKEDSEAHDALLCIGTGRIIEDTSRLKFQTDQFYLRSPEEMFKIFGDIPEALSNTMAVAEKCSLDINFKEFHLPHFETPSGETADTYLARLANEGLIKRYGSIIPEYKQRLDYELGVIKSMDFSSYFLIVWDFIRFARDNGILVGPGRGSGAGSLAAYCLFITNVCPMEHGLLFERFLNPDRKSMPDLDIDFLDSRRDEVINYVCGKYGYENVARIITFGTLMARLVVRDVGRVMNVPLNEVDAIAKLIPREAGTVMNAVKIVPELKSLYKENAKVKKMLDIASKLEGLKRHTGVHAAGVVITKNKITEYAPLAKSSKDIITTQYEDESLLSLGLLKVDFLGLSTLSIIDMAAKEIRKKTKPDFDIEKIPMDDKKAYKLLSSAQALGVFQLDSQGMRDLLRKIKPQSMSDIVALISLFRPGPMGSGMLDDFVARKHKRVEIKFDHPVLEPILKDTLGVIVYQEQVMRIATDMAGFTPGQADVLRKAMGKKIPEEMEKQRNVFVEGARKKGIDAKLAGRIFEQMAHFGGYGFNKSHATAYALISYRCAYLKANFPVEYMCALVSSEIGSNVSKDGKESDLVIFLREAESMNIPILGPDINKSDGNFSIEEYSGQEGRQANTRAVRFGLLAVKNVGFAAVESILEERSRGGRFESFEDFAMRVDQGKANKKVIESLAKSGAFDIFGSNPNKVRPGILFFMDNILSKAQKTKDEKSTGQRSLFGAEEMESVQPLDISGVEEWQEHDLLAAEKDVLGLYFTGHPLAKYAEELKKYSHASITEALAGQTGITNGSLRLAGMISNTRKLFTKEKKEAYARFRLEDLDDEIECIVFPRTFAGKSAVHITPNNIVVVKGKLNKRDDNVEMLIDEIIPIEDAKTNLITKVAVCFNSAGLDETLLEQVNAIMRKYPGGARLQFHVINDVSGRVTNIDSGLKVNPSQEFQNEIENILGKESLRILT